jgi:hypothetical protein
MLRIVTHAPSRDIKKKIEEGDGLPDMARTQECVAALKAAGFELIEARDMVRLRCKRQVFVLT